jgi:hypothetical protein
MTNLFNFASLTRHLGELNIFYDVRGERGKLMKKHVAGALAAILISLLFITSAVAEPVPIKVLVNYKLVEFPDDFNPYMVNYRTMVPVRGVFEAMNSEVTWKRNEQGKIEVTAKHFDDVVVLTVGSTEAFRNGEKVLLDAPAEIRNNRMTVPLRFISEAFGGDVKWIPSGESGNNFHYIRIDGQFRYPVAITPTEVQTEHHDVGYGEPYAITSFPFVVKHDTFKLTIHNITNSFPVWNMPNNKRLYSRAFVGDQPDLDGLDGFDSGFIRIDAEFEATTDRGYQVDEMQQQHGIFEVDYENMRGTRTASTIFFQVPIGDLVPYKFEGFMESKFLKKGETIRGILPFEYFFNKRNNDEILINLWTRDSKTIALSFKVELLRKW